MTLEALHEFRRLVSELSHYLEGLTRVSVGSYELEAVSRARADGARLLLVELRRRLAAWEVNLERKQSTGADTGSHGSAGDSSAFRSAEPPARSVG